MKRILSIYILSFLVFSFSTIREKHFYKFIGYIDKDPVFFDEVDNVIIKRKQNNLEIIKKIPLNKKAVFVKDDFLVLEVLENNKLFALLINNKQQKKIKLNSEMTYITGYKNHIFYTDLNTLDIIMITMEGEKKMNIKGWVIGVVKNYLYFSKISKSELPGPNIDVYKIKINDPNSTIQKVASNLSGENTLIFQNGEYIYLYDMVLHSGEYTPTLINVSKGKCEILDIPNEYKYGTPYFSNINKSINFYNSENLEIFIYHIHSRDCGK